MIHRPCSPGEKNINTAAAIAKPGFFDILHSLIVDCYGLVPLVLQDGYGGFLPQRPYIRRGQRRGFTFGLPAHRSLDALILG